MKLHLLQSNKKSPKRVGRGISSGRGKTAGRGTKGQKARSGGNIPAYFEGGQNPLVHRLPKQKGFSSRRASMQIVHTEQLNKFKAGATVKLADLKTAGLISDTARPVKLLKRGELTKAINLEIPYCSRSAIDALASAGGKFTARSGKAP